jgi:N-acetyl-anhydromuramyl-L-alanine amidase AmpD
MKKILKIGIVFLFSCKKDYTVSIKSNWPTEINLNGNVTVSDNYTASLKNKNTITTKDSAHFYIKENGTIIIQQFTNNLKFNK